MREASGRYQAARPASRISQLRSLTDQAIVYPAHLLGHRQLTDAYLLALAVHNGGQFVTLDGAMPIPAVQGAKAGDLVRLIR